MTELQKEKLKKLIEEYSFGAPEVSRCLQEHLDGPKTYDKTFLGYYMWVRGMKDWKEFDQLSEPCKLAREIYLNIAAPEFDL